LLLALDDRKRKALHPHAAPTFLVQAAGIRCSLDSAEDEIDTFAELATRSGTGGLVRGEAASRREPLGLCHHLVRVKEFGLASFVGSDPAADFLPPGLLDRGIC
jgi:hypothetical protein